METRVRAVTRIDSLALAQYEVTDFGDPLPSYVAGAASATGVVTFADGTTLYLGTQLTAAERDTLNSLCDAIGARVLREMVERLR